MVWFHKARYISVHRAADARFIHQWIPSNILAFGYFFKCTRQLDLCLIDSYTPVHMLETNEQKRQSCFWDSATVAKGAANNPQMSISSWKIMKLKTIILKFNMKIKRLRHNIHDYPIFIQYLYNYCLPSDTPGNTTETMTCQRWPSKCFQSNIRFPRKTALTL